MFLKQTHVGRINNNHTNLVNQRWQKIIKQDQSLKKWWGGLEGKINNLQLFFICWIYDSIVNENVERFKITL